MPVLPGGQRQLHLAATDVVGRVPEHGLDERGTERQVIDDRACLRLRLGGDDCKRVPNARQRQRRVRQCPDTRCADPPTCSKRPFQLSRSRKPTSSPAINGSSSSATTCSRRWSRAACSFSIALSAKKRCGTICRAGAGATDREESEVLRHRRLSGRSRNRHGIAHEHHPAGLLLRHIESLPGEEAIEAIRKSIRDTYGKKGEEVVQKNLSAVDETLAHLFEVKIPDRPTSQTEMPAPFSAEAPKYERDVLGTIYAGHGDDASRERFPTPTGPFPPAPRNGRSVTSRSKFLCGTRKPASSAASARWSARMR